MNNETLSGELRMKREHVNACGLACPQPVVLSKKAIDKIVEGEVFVVVDSEAAKEDITRMAIAGGCSVTVTEKETGVVELHIIKSPAIRSNLKAKASSRPPFSYCPWCKGELTRDNPFRQECPLCGFILYHSSSPCMGALPVDGSGNVLLARRGIEPFYGDWNTIGGFLNYQEDPFEGLMREVREETGVACTILEFITLSADVYGDDGQALLNAYFTVRLHSQDFHPQDDVSELRWFSLDELPENLAFSSDRKALAALREKLHCKAPDA